MLVQKMAVHVGVRVKTWWQARRRMADGGFSGPFEGHRNVRGDWRTASPREAAAHNFKARA